MDLVHTSSPSSPEKTPAHGPTKVKGSLKDHISFWSGINTNQCIISIIRDGYALPFVELPPEKMRELMLHSKLKSYYCRVV